MSQVQFSKSWSQDFGTHDRRSQVRGFQFQGCGSQDPVKISGLGSQLLILDYADKPDCQEQNTNYFDKWFAIYSTIFLY